MEQTVIQIPVTISHIFGVNEPGTRIYRKDGGTEEENSVWFDAVCEVAGPVVSPGGACMYAPVSRAAVHQRIKDGKLTAFLFHVRRKRKNWLGRPRETRQSAFIYIPVCELKLWAEEIKERAIKQGKVTRKELERAESDWKKDFLQWKNEREQENSFGVMKDNGIFPFVLFQLMALGKWVDPDIRKVEEENEKIPNTVYRDEPLDVTKAD